MENKRMAAFVVMILMFGNLMVELKAINVGYPVCVLNCIDLCLLNPWEKVKKTQCPSKCAKKCKKPILR